MDRIRQHVGAGTAAGNPEAETADDQAFYDFLEQAFPEVGGTADPPPDANGGPVEEKPPVQKAPKCGETCFGQLNPCSTADSCRCIADPWQGVGSARFQGTCKNSYFSYAWGSRGRGLLANGTNNMDVILVDGRPPKSTGDPAGSFASAVAELKASGTLAATFPKGSIAPAACPCNCTYASTQCCVADPDEGLVYEAPSKNLGPLEPPAGQCCDTITGLFTDGSRDGSEPFCAGKKSQSAASWGGATA